MTGPPFRWLYHNLIPITITLLLLAVLIKSQTAEDALAKMQQEIAMLEMSIPGEAGRDYTIFNEVPQSSFLCSEQQFPGYYADVDLGCQVFYICQENGKQDSFLCPNGTVFNQQYFVCDWWFNFNCANARTFYVLNQNLYQEMGSNLHQGLEQIMDPSFLLSGGSPSSPRVARPSPATHPRPSTPLQPRFEQPVTQKVILSQFDEVKSPVSFAQNTQVKTAATFRAPSTVTQTFAQDAFVSSSSRPAPQQTQFQSPDLGYGFDEPEEEVILTTPQPVVKVTTPRPFVTISTTEQPPSTTFRTTTAVPTTFRTTTFAPTTFRTTTFAPTTFRPTTEIPTTFRSTTTTLRPVVSTTVAPKVNEQPIGYDFDVRSNVADVKSQSAPSPTTIVSSTASPILTTSSPPLSTTYFPTSSTTTSQGLSLDVRAQTPSSQPIPMQVSLKKPLTVEGPPTIEVTAARPPPFIQQNSGHQQKGVQQSIKFSQPLPPHPEINQNQQFLPQQPLIHTMSFLPENHPFQQQFAAHQHGPLPPPPREFLSQFQHLPPPPLPNSSPMHLDQQMFRQPIKSQEQINFHQFQNQQQFHNQQQFQNQQHLQNQQQFQNQQNFQNQAQFQNQQHFQNQQNVQQQQQFQKSLFKGQEQMSTPAPFRHEEFQLQAPQFIGGNRPETPLLLKMREFQKSVMEIPLSTRAPLQIPQAINVVTPPNMLPAVDFRPMEQAMRNEDFHKSIMKQQQNLPTPSPHIKFQSQPPPQLTSTPPTPLLDVRQFQTPQSIPVTTSSPPPLPNFLPEKNQMLEHSSPLPPPHHHDVVRLSTPPSSSPPPQFNEVLVSSSPHPPHFMEHQMAPPPPIKSIQQFQQFEQHTNALHHQPPPLFHQQNADQFRKQVEQHQNIEQNRFQEFEQQNFMMQQHREQNFKHEEEQFHKSVMKNQQQFQQNFQHQEFNQFSEHSGMRPHRNEFEGNREPPKDFQKSINRPQQNFDAHQINQHPVKEFHETNFRPEPRPVFTAQNDFHKPMEEMSRPHHNFQQQQFNQIQENMEFNRPPPQEFIKSVHKEEFHQVQQSFSTPPPPKEFFKSIDRPQLPSHEPQTFTQNHFERPPQEPERPQNEPPKQHVQLPPPQKEFFKSIDRPQQQFPIQENHQQHFPNPNQHQQQQPEFIKSIDQPKQQFHQQQFPEQNHHQQHPVQEQRPQHHDQRQQEFVKSIDRPQQQFPVQNKHQQQPQHPVQEHRPQHHDQRQQEFVKSIDRPQQQFPVQNNHQQPPHPVQEHRPQHQDQRQQEFVKLIDRPQQQFPVQNHHQQPPHPVNEPRPQQHPQQQKDKSIHRQPENFQHQNKNQNNVMELPPIFIPRTKQKPALEPLKPNQQFNNQHKSIHQENRFHSNNQHQNNNFDSHQQHKQQGQFSHSNHHDDNDFNMGPLNQHDLQSYAPENSQGRLMVSYASSGGSMSDYSNYLPMQKEIAILKYK